VTEKNAKLTQPEKPAAPKRRRLQPDDREKLIVQEAIKFFADVGFEGRTRDLAKRIGVTQPLLYRYFPNKESLIERVYEEVYLGRLNPEWTERLLDRTEPLRDRLVAFYTDYQRTVSNYDWVRIFMYSGLRGVGINQKYLAVLEKRVLIPIYSELRIYAGLPENKGQPVPEQDMELIWSLHGQFFYRSVRKLIYKLPVPDDLSRILEYEIDSFLLSAPKMLTQMTAP
jgi:AcrR family transcriptional regulator